MSTISSINSGTAQALGSATGAQQAHHHHRHGGGKEVASALQSLGIDTTKAADIQKQIDAAVKAAQQNGASATSGSDPRAAIKDAIDGALKQNGIDPLKFEAAIRSQHKSHQQVANPGATAPDSDGDNDQSPTTLTSNGSIDTTA